MNILDKANIIMVSRYKRRSPIAKWGFSTEKNGIYLSGAEEDRTPDLSIANAALSQLSYGPKNIIEFRSFIERIPKRTENTCKIFLLDKNQILIER